MSSADWRTAAEMHSHAKDEPLGESLRNGLSYYTSQHEKQTHGHSLMESLDSAPGLGSLHVEEHHAHLHHHDDHLQTHMEAASSNLMPGICGSVNVRQFVFASKTGTSAYDQFMEWKERSTEGIRFVRAARVSGNTIRTLGPYGKGKKRAGSQLKKLGVDVSEEESETFRKAHHRRLICQYEAQRINSFNSDVKVIPQDGAVCQSYIKALGWSPGKFEESLYILVEFMDKHSHAVEGDSFRNTYVQGRLHNVGHAAEQQMANNLIASLKAPFVDISTLSQSLLALSEMVSEWHSDILPDDINRDTLEILAQSEALLKRLQEMKHMPSASRLVPHTLDSNLAGDEEDDDGSHWTGPNKKPRGM